MSCDKVQELLMEYLDQDLKKEESSFVQSHLHECSICSKKRDDIERLRSFVLKTTVSLPASFFEAMRRSLFEKIRQSRSSKEITFEHIPHRRWVPILVPATLTAVALFVGIRFVSLHYQEYAMKRDFTELALLQENEQPGSLDVYPEESESLSSDESIKEDIELLNALGEGDKIDENGEELERLEEEATFLDQEVAG